MEKSDSNVRLVEVYRAKDALQAHLIRGALKDSGIVAFVEGDLLQAAIGDLPMGWPTAPRIMVGESDAAAALKILDEFDRGKTVASPDDDKFEDE